MRMSWRAILSLFIFVAAAAGAAEAQDSSVLNDAGTSELIRIGLLLTLLSIVPAVLITMTSMIRIVIVMAMVRHAFGMPETPPNQVLVALSLFLTLFVMGPTFEVMNTEALQPLLAGTIDVEAAIANGLAPLKTFMLNQTTDADIASMYALAGEPLPQTPDDVQLLKLAPAFIVHELRVAFTIGFVILLPFLLIDLVVSSILLSLGMMMVPPATISLPIKLLMFIIIDGWSLVIEGVISGFV